MSGLGGLAVRSLRPVLRADLPTKALIVEALLAVLWASLVARLTPWRRLAGRLDLKMTEPPPNVAVDRIVTAVHVGRMVRRIANALVGTNSCLVQAIAVRWMLRCRGIPCRSALGVRQSAPGRLESHAWVRVGDVVVSGGPQHRVFIPFEPDTSTRSRS